MFDKPMPAKTAHAIVSNYRVLLPLAQEYEQDRAMMPGAIAKEEDAGKPQVDDLGNLVLDDPELFAAELRLLNAVESTVALKPVRVGDLPDCSPQMMSALLPILEVAP